MAKSKDKTPVSITDNDPKHKAKCVEKFFKNNNVNWIKDWPSYSPDLNPIENLWSKLKSQIQFDQPKDKKELKKSIKKQWKSIQQSTCQNLINSFRDRCQSIIDSNGEKINY
ncbi:hypothetical protein ABPG72_020113 [Tetrahymena utriculariae]